MLLLAMMLVLAAGDAGPAATVQQVFDGMARHDAEGLRGIFTPGAALVSLRADGTLSTTPTDKWLERMGTSKDAWLERMWNPQVLEKGSIAVVWAPYDFHLNGKFSHCGIDTVNLLKVSGVWKVTGITYTTETANCAPSPLGPPTK
jgi:hypothetical protein